MAMDRYTTRSLGENVRGVRTLPIVIPCGLAVAHASSLFTYGYILNQLLICPQDGPLFDVELTAVFKTTADLLFSSHLHRPAPSRSPDHPLS